MTTMITPVVEEQEEPVGGVHQSDLGAFPIPSTGFLNVVRDRSSEVTMIRLFAAEVIQEAYRRYRECKTAIKFRRINSSGRFVMNLASDVIKNTFIRATYLKARAARAKRMSKEVNAPPVIHSLTDDCNNGNLVHSKTVAGPGETELIINDSIVSEESQCMERTKADCSRKENRVINALVPISLNISYIKATELPNVKWNGRNDVYVIISCGMRVFRTETLWEAGSEAYWKDLKASVLINVDDDSRLISHGLVVEVYNKNLARGDQMIGCGRVDLEEFEVIDAPVQLEDKSELEETPVTSAPFQDCVVNLSFTSGSRATPTPRPRGVVNLGLCFMRVPSEEESFRSPSLAPSAPVTIREKENLPKFSLNTLAETEFRLPTLSVKKTPDAAVRSSRQEGADSSIALEKPQLKQNDCNRASSPAQSASWTALSRTAVSISREVSNRSVGSSEGSTRTRVSASPATSDGRRLVRISPDVHGQVTDVFRVVDAAFASAIRFECSIICLRPSEILLILDALGISLQRPDGLGAISSENLSEAARNHRKLDWIANDDATVEVSMLNAASLAAVLTKFVRENFLVSQVDSFSMSESCSQIAAKNLKHLVEGDWKNLRRVILSASGRIDHGSGRPSRWSEKWIQRLIKFLKFSNEKFEAMNGSIFLAIDKSELQTKYDIRPSLLKVRFCVYQHVLRLLEQWWDRGLRPNDQHSSDLTLGMSIAEREFNISSEPLSSSVKGMTVASSRWTPHDERSTNSGGSGLKRRWGRLDRDLDCWDEEISRITADDVTLVEIASFHALLQAWIPLNRAYGWNVSIEDLTLLASKCSEAKGYLVCVKSNFNSRQQAHSETEWNPCNRRVRECRWVAFANEGASAGPHIEYSDLIGTINEFSLRSNVVVGESRFSGENCVLIPLCCLRSVASKSGKSNLLSEFDPTEIDVGDVVRVANDLTLNRACERFDWWDRPPTVVLMKLADRLGEIVSTQELSSKQRVGVRVFVGDKDIVDALPTDALYRMNAESLEALKREAEVNEDKKANRVKRLNSTGAAVEVLATNDNEGGQSAMKRSASQKSKLSAKRKKKKKSTKELSKIPGSPSAQDMADTIMAVIEDSKNPPKIQAMETGVASTNRKTPHETISHVISTEPPKPHTERNIFKNKIKSIEVHRAKNESLDLGERKEEPTKGHESLNEREDSISDPIETVNYSWLKSRRPPSPLPSALELSKPETHPKTARLSVCLPVFDADHAIYYDGTHHDDTHRRRHDKGEEQRGAASEQDKSSAVPSTRRKSFPRSPQPWERAVKTANVILEGKFSVDEAEPEEKSPVPQQTPQNGHFAVPVLLTLGLDAPLPSEGRVLRPTVRKTPLKYAAVAHHDEDFINRPGSGPAGLVFDPPDVPENARKVSTKRPTSANDATRGRKQTQRDTIEAPDVAAPSKGKFRPNQLFEFDELVGARTKQNELNALFKEKVVV